MLAKDYYYHLLITPGGIAELDFVWCYINDCILIGTAAAHGPAVPESTASTPEQNLWPANCTTVATGRPVRTVHSSTGETYCPCTIEIAR